MLISGAATYYTTSLPDRMESGSMSASTSWMDSAKQAGWAMAGAYYRDLVGGGATNQVSVKDIQKFGKFYLDQPPFYFDDSSGPYGMMYTRGCSRIQ